MFSGTSLGGVSAATSATQKQKQVGGLCWLHRASNLRKRM
jgi:hypothetical protein